MSNDEWMTIDEVAAQLGYTRGWTDNVIRKHGPFRKRDGKRWLYKRTAIVAMTKLENSEPPPPDSNGNGHAPSPDWTGLWQIARSAVDAGLMTDREALERLAARTGVKW